MAIVNAFLRMHILSRSEQKVTLHSNRVAMAVTQENI